MMNTMEAIRKHHLLYLIVFFSIIVICLMTQVEVMPTYYKFDKMLVRNALVYDMVRTDGPTRLTGTVLEDLYVSVKTSGRFHKSRVALILKTWWETMKQQTYIFTDTEDEALSNHSGGHLVVTKCGKTHNWYELCCKMGEEYDGFYASNKTWWCHIDDDNYVNPAQLLSVLNEYDWKLPLYVGRPSREGDQIHRYKKQKVILRFATGGAGICITRNLTELMAPWMRKGLFEKTCRDLSQPDDVTLGFIATNRINVRLIRRNDFNSHLQDLTQIPRESLLSQAILSYTDNVKSTNFINLTDDMSVFPMNEDRTRMLSYHCLLYPQTDWCPERSVNLKRNESI